MRHKKSKYWNKRSQFCDYGIGVISKGRILIITVKIMKRKAKCVDFEDKITQLKVILLGLKIKLVTFSKSEQWYKSEWTSWHQKSIYISWKMGLKVKIMTYKAVRSKL